MKNLLFRADDLGWSYGINYGIAKTVSVGLINNVGVMVNMGAATHGLDLLRGADICLGQHTNICIGKPLTNPDLIPSLVDSEGFFKRSKIYRAAKDDFVVFDEVMLEVEAQHKRFVELAGREPDYFEGHAVRSENFFRALEIVAARHGLKYSGMPQGNEPVSINGKSVYMLMESTNPDYKPFETLKRLVSVIPDSGYGMMVCHPGYLDMDILRNSSLTMPRPMEVEMLCDSAVHDWLKRERVRLISYADL